MPDSSTPDLEFARRLAAASGIKLEGERLELYASSVARNAEALRRVAGRDYGTTEPAPRFRAPSSRE